MKEEEQAGKSKLSGMTLRLPIIILDRPKPSCIFP
jgi:hypothetical protein